MATEPVNERPIFPSMIRADSIGVGNWSVSMIRQLTTVFQQYGFRLNKALLDEDLASHDNGDGTIPEVDQENTWVASQIFQNAPTANGHPLRWQELARNGGTIPEVDRSNTFAPAQVFQQTPSATGNPLRFDELASSGSGGQIPELDRLNRFTDTQQVFSDGSGVRGWERRLSAEPSTGGWDREVVSERVSGNGHPVRLGLFGSGTSMSNGYVGAHAAYGSSSIARLDGLNWNEDNAYRIGRPSGGFQGTGTLNAEALYDDGTLLTDYVFDAEADGSIDTQKYDDSVPNRRREDIDGQVHEEERCHAPAKRFAQCMNELDPQQFAQKWRAERKLPALQNCNSKPSIGGLTQALLETCEVQAVHIAKLEERIAALEAQ